LFARTTTLRNLRRFNPAAFPFMSRAWVIAKAQEQGRLSFRAKPADAVATSDAIFICVGTPPLPDGDADLSAIDDVARMVASEATSPKLVIEKSTVPARTGHELKRALSVYAQTGRLAARGIESRVPARRRGRGGFSPSRPRGGGRGRRNRRTPASRYLPAGAGAQIQLSRARAGVSGWPCPAMAGDDHQRSALPWHGSFFRSISYAKELHWFRLPVSMAITQFCEASYS
jgi:UDP-glucose/GDP-mannose dehydrogenase family, NAD binding domain